jgi:hypothetical protein
VTRDHRAIRGIRDHREIQARRGIPGQRVILEIQAQRVIRGILELLARMAQMPYGISEVPSA